MATCQGLKVRGRIPAASWPYALTLGLIVSFPFEYCTLQEVALLRSLVHFSPFHAVSTRDLGIFIIQIDSLCEISSTPAPCPEKIHFLAGTSPGLVDNGD